MTHQETFNLCASHLLRQGVPSIIGKRFRYRGPKGRKCPAGALIPDKDYKKNLEGLDAGCKKVAKILEKLEHNVRLVAVFQEIHDTMEPDEWRVAIRCLANGWRLSDAVLESAPRIRRTHKVRPVPMRTRPY